jgi:hypothetical protein
MQSSLEQHEYVKILIKKNQEHKIITLQDRLSLYSSFGPSRLSAPAFIRQSIEFNEEDFLLYYSRLFNALSLADLVICYLAITTIQQVLPIWHESRKTLDNSFLDTPLDILTLARDLLNRKTAFNEVYMLLNEHSYLYTSMKYSTTYNGFQVYNGSISMLNTILFGLQNVPPKTNSYSDFAQYAYEAYSYSDNKEPGEWVKLKEDYDTRKLREAIIKTQSSVEFDDNFLPHEDDITMSWGDTPNSHFEETSQNLETEEIPWVSVDSNKKQAFWDWWLTEAIPQAWELAQQSTK